MQNKELLEIMTHLGDMFHVNLILHIEMMTPVKSSKSGQMLPLSIIGWAKEIKSDTTFDSTRNRRAACFSIT